MSENKGFNPEFLPHLENRDFEPYEHEDIKRRIEEARRELSELWGRVHDLLSIESKSVPESLPTSSPIDAITDMLAELFQRESQSGLNGTVLRRMANRVVQQILWTRITSTPIFHEMLALSPWWLTRLPFDMLLQLRDIGLRYVLNGIVIPIQTVRRHFLEAPAVYIGHCVCRSSGLVNDLTTNGKNFTVLSEAENHLLLERIMTAWRESKEDGSLESDENRVTSILNRLEDLAEEGSDTYRLETFFSDLYPMWEFIPIHNEYTANWARSMYLNNKAVPLPPQLAVEIANALFYSRGTIFSSMKMLDTKYTICSCPSPENSGGCILTNWYYYAQANESLLANQSIHGQLKDDEGNVLPCRVFPSRSHRPCLGCGCQHESSFPRDLKQGFDETDELLHSLGYM